MGIAEVAEEEEDWEYHSPAHQRTRVEIKDDVMKNTTRGTPEGKEGEWLGLLIIRNPLYLFHIIRILKFIEASTNQ